METTRRTFLQASVAAAVAARTALTGDAAGRLGIMCQLVPGEEPARSVLGAARRAGFTRAQITFPWDRAGEDFVRAVPGLLASEGLRADVIGIYVNCASPETVLMGARGEDMVRAVELATKTGATRLTAWTGGYGKELMTSDPRNAAPGAADAICRYLEPRLKLLESSRLVLALETYNTLVCPDAPALRRLLDRLPPFVTAVMDPPNLTPVERFDQRDSVLGEMFRILEGRIGVAHLKDFRRGKDGRTFELPGPLGGEMNYPLFVEHLKKLPPGIPWIAEHLRPEEFTAARAKLLPLM